VRTPALIASVTAAVEEDRRICIEALATAHGTSVSTIHAVLHDDLGLEKKSARWVPKLLNDEQKKQHVEVCSEFVKAVHRHSLAMLDSIVTMDETMVCYHMPQSKKQSQKWIEKGLPGPIKAKVQASRSKQMLLAFFDSKGLIYTHIVPRGSTVNAAYIVKVPDVFMRHFKKKRPVMAEQPWFFQWDNAPVHNATIVQDWLVAHDVQVLRHPPYSPDLAPADLLFRCVKEELAGVTLDHSTLKKEWEGVTRKSPPRSSPPPFSGGSSTAKSVLR
jgi:histone-lysine N-methyltransferase SETMAR